MEMGVWRGYTERRKDSPRRTRYSVPVDNEKLEILWKKFKEWKGSQREFYFKFVNKLAIMEPVPQQYGRTRITSK